MRRLEGSRSFLPDRFDAILARMGLPIFVRRLNRRVRMPIETAQLLWTTGAFADPVGLAKQWLHRRLIKRVHRSLFDFRYATALLLAQRVGLLACLDAGPKSFAQAASHLDAQPRAVEALMRVLESQGMLSQQDGVFALSKAGRLLLSADSPHGITNMLELMSAQAEAFGQIVSGMRSGATPAALDIFDQSGSYQAFLDAVNAYLLLATRDLLSRIELGPIRDLIVGSMGVSFSAVVLERHPEARVSYGCLDHLVAEIPRLRDTYGVPPERVLGMHCHGGDPSEDRWGDEAFDLVMLTKKMILAPEQRMGEKFATKAFEVLRPGGVCIFWECLHTHGRPTPLPRAMEAVLDLGASPAGLVNTEQSFRELLARIGYGDIQVVPCLAGTTTFVVARKR